MIETRVTVIGGGLAGSEAAWVERLRPHLSGRTLYAFFNNTYAAQAPRNAAVLREMLDAI